MNSLFSIDQEATKQVFTGLIIAIQHYTSEDFNENKAPFQLILEGDVFSKGL